MLAFDRRSGYQSFWREGEGANARGISKNKERNTMTIREQLSQELE